MIGIFSCRGRGEEAEQHHAEGDAQGAADAHHAAAGAQRDAVGAPLAAAQGAGHDDHGRGRLPRCGGHQRGGRGGIHGPRVLRDSAAKGRRAVDLP